MGETTGIVWTNSTINAWHGCTKVSDGCKHCYAEVSTPVRVKRAAGLEVWGAKAARSETKGWEAQIRSMAHDVIYSAAGGPHRVFGQSLSDTFEDRRDLDPLRARFFAAMTRWTARSLTFQLLTKRPENVLRMVPPAWLTSWPAHVWIGATVESQAMAEERIPHLLRVPAPVRFLSVEPQIEAVLLDDGERSWLTCHGEPAEECCGSMSAHGRHFHGIDWVIQGGESGSKARPFDLRWARSMRDQCRAAGVAYFLKQLGAAPVEHPRVGGMIGKIAATVYDAIRLHDSHGGDESEWPEDLRGCRAFPEAPHG
jgi:protein gp37